MQETSPFGIPARSPASAMMRIVSAQHFAANGWGAITIAFFAFTAINVLNIVVDVGFVDGVTFERVIIYGKPANEIVDYAKKNKVDLLIMGSNGLEGLAKIKGLGSVSRKVSERISCPITIIR